eukprot:Gb_33019 [translate_table: standard]
MCAIREFSPIRPDHCITLGSISDYTLLSHVPRPSDVILLLSSTSYGYICEHMGSKKRNKVPFPLSCSRREPYQKNPRCFQSILPAPFSDSVTEAQQPPLIREEYQSQRDQGNGSWHVNALLQSRSQPRHKNFYGNLTGTCQHY